MPKIKNTAKHGKQYQTMSLGGIRTHSLPVGTVEISDEALRDIKSNPTFKQDLANGIVIVLSDAAEVEPEIQEAADFLNEASTYVSTLEGDSPETPAKAEETPEPKDEKPEPEKKGPGRPSKSTAAAKK